MRKRKYRIKFSSIIFCFLILSLSLLSLISAYYILVNAVLEDKVLPNVSLNGDSLALSDEEEVARYIYVEYLPGINDSLDVFIDDYSFSIPREDLNIEADYSNILDFGKSVNIITVLRQGLTLLNGEEIHPDITIDIMPIIEKLPVEKSERSAKVLDGNVINCNSGVYDIQIDRNLLLALAIDAVKYRKPLKSSFLDLASSDKEAKIYPLCIRYEKDVEAFKEATGKLGISEDLIEEVFSLNVNGSRKAEWIVKDKDKLKSTLRELKIERDFPPFEGSYEIIDDKVLLFEPPEEGSGIDVSETTEAISLWLLDPTENIPLIYEPIDVKGFDSDYEVIDFTKYMASGKTRIDLVRDGHRNLQVPNAQAGIEELHNKVVLPGEEFCFMEALNPVDGRTREGRRFGGGVCNSSTTLFRAVLDAGFPITERSAHSFYVDSYKWGPYPMNIVDAAVFTNPFVDFCFVNDLEYPIALRAEIKQKEDGYQYHTIHIYTSSKAPGRRVMLTNWQKWSIVNAKRFHGSFDRIVYENERKIREDTFISMFVHQRY